MLVRRSANPEFVKVLDFGVAKLQTDQKQTKTGVLMGTPMYMAPEQWETLPDVDGRADLYALGAILYECLTGRPPYDGPNTYALLMAHMNNPVPDPAKLAPETPAELSDLVQRLLAKSRNDRPPSATKVLGALRRISGQPDGAEAKELPAEATRVLGLQPSPSTPPSPSPSPTRRSLTLRHQTGELIHFIVDRRRLTPALLGVAGALAVVLLALGLRPRPAAVPLPPPTPALPEPAPAPKPEPQQLLPPELVVFGPGTFQQGFGSGLSQADGPAHPVAVGRFALGKTEVSLGEFRAYADAVKLPPPLPWDGVDDFAAISDLPVNQVTREQAALYCAWRYRSWGGRLPTESEWEYAARGAGGEGRFPWPDAKLASLPASLLPRVNLGRRPARLLPVTSLPEGQSPQGLLHLLGNVEEWTQSDATAYPGSSYQLPVGLGAVVRGGGADTPPESVSATRRGFLAPHKRYRFVGFRCAATPS